MTKEEEMECINDCIVKREEAKRKGNESEVEEMTKMLKKKGFEIKDEEDLGKRKKANL